MIINGSKLLQLAPIANMIPSKERFEGTSHGLAEAGYDLQINQDIHFQPYSWKEGARIGVKDHFGNSTTYVGRFCIASAKELFQMPQNLVGVVHDKSTWARKGLSVFNTVIEPGWNGYLTLELVFHGNEEIIIKRGQGIAQVLFSELVEPGDYGDGKYQNQENRPVNAISS